jgi:hypothetical protein
MFLIYTCGDLCDSLSLSFESHARPLPESTESVSRVLLLKLFMSSSSPQLSQGWNLNSLAAMVPQVVGPLFNELLCRSVTLESTKLVYEWGTNIGHGRGGQAQK